MLRTRLTMLAVAVSLAVVATAARANFYEDVQYVSGADPSSTAYDAVITDRTQQVVLNVYALITDPSPSSSVDQFKSMASNFYVASSVLLGDVYFKSWSSNATGSGVAGTQFITTYGGLGLGGSSTTVTSTAAWWYPVATSNPLNGSNAITAPTVIPGVGTEYLLGQLTVTFSNNATIPSGATAQFLANTPNKYSVATKPDQWIDNNGTWTSVFGSASNIGNGANQLTYPAVSGHGLVFTTQGGPPPTGVADIGASLAVSGATTGLGGAVLPLLGNVTNIGSPSTTLNWNSSGPAAFVISPSFGATNQGSPTPLTGSWTLPSGRMGTVTGTVTFTGSDSVTGLAVTHSPVAVPVSAYVVGHSTTSFAGSDGTGTPGGPYYNLVSTQTAQNIAGLGATLGNSATSSGIGATSMQILAGNLSASVSAAWRPRAAGELPSNPPHAPGYLPLYSDVLSLTGITTGTPYVLQMTYDPAQLGTTSPTGGALYLGYRSTEDGNWHYATAALTDGNTGNNATAAQQDYIGSFASFTATYGGTLTSYMGAWGVDPVHNDVWAVVNHDAEFAAVPEPGTIALLVGGLLALGVAYRRRFAK